MVLDWCEDCAEEEKDTERFASDLYHIAGLRTYIKKRVFLG